MRKKFFIVLLVLYGLGILGNLLRLKILDVIFIGVVPVISLWLTYKYINQSLLVVPLVDGPLTSEEKKKVMITEFFSPVISGAFYYFCWKKVFPIKAKQANKYSWIIFLIQILFSGVASTLLSYSK
jgi:hypothetical protein